MSNITIRPMEPEDWNAVSEIYSEGIATEHATFQTTCPPYTAWDAFHIKECRLVILDGGELAVSNGCQIEGTVENSVIGRGCVIKKGAIVRNSVVLAEATVGEGVHVENEVVDKWAKLVHKKEIVSPTEQPGYIRRNDTL